MRRIIWVLAVLSVASPLSAAGPWAGKWIWNKVPAGNVWFRKSFLVRSGVASAKIAITADNSFELWVNGAKVGSDSEWRTVHVYDITRLVRPGTNVLAVRATDNDATVGGLLVEVAIACKDGSAQLVGSDRTWRLAVDENDGWMKPDFDDSGWNESTEIGPPPTEPWGGLEHPSLLPKSTLKTLEVKWPRGAKPGDVIDVTCSAVPEQRILVDSAVALRLLVRNEPAFEHWIDAPSPVTSWKPGQAVKITFRSIRLPAYLPEGRLRAQVITAVTESKGGYEVLLGSERRRTSPRVVGITLLRAMLRSAISGRVLDVRWRAAGQAPSGFMVTLWRGQELWVAQNALRSPARLVVPTGLPAGSYSVKVLPHAALCPKCPSVSIRLAGPPKPTVRALGYGTYLDRDGVPHRWFVNRAGTLIWDGKPYVPAGAMYLSNFFMSYRLGNPVRNEEAFRDDIKRLLEMKNAGISDIYLNPCAKWRERPAWVWQRFADLCEGIGLRYGIQVTEETDQLRFWDVHSSVYTASIKGGETARIMVTSDLLTSIGPTNAALYVAFDSNTGEPVDGGTARVLPALNGVWVEATPRAEVHRSLMVYFVPERNYEGGLHDYWTCVNDTFKKALNGFFSELRLGPNMRLWIDPLDNEQGLGGYTNRALPNSTGFRLMFADWLKHKYGSVHNLARAWGIGASGYEVFARLVPCVAVSDGGTVGFAIDPPTGRVFKVNAVRSAMWRDIIYFRDNSIAEFNNRIAEMIKRYHDVPVVLKHEGTDMYTNRWTHGGFDGLGAEAYGSDIEHIKDCSRAVHSQALQCGRTMWELTTETGLVWTAPGYPDPLRMFSELASMVQMGAKGTYCFLIMVPSGSPNADWYVFNLAEDPRQYWWLGTYARALKSSQALPDYRPETMASAPQADFMRRVLGLQVLDLGRAFQALRFGSTTYVWNMADIPLSIDMYSSGKTTKSLELPARAARPAVIDEAPGISPASAEKANLAAAMHDWREVTARAQEIGMPVPFVPVDDWRKLYAQVDALRKALGDASAFPMDSVSVDGDLAEWVSIAPLYVKLNNGVAGSRYEKAKFYVGYDQDWLYVAGEVNDPTVVNNNRLEKIWDGDAVEIFVDLHPDSSPGDAAYNADCFQFIFSPTSADGQPGMAIFNPGLAPGSQLVRSRLAVKQDEWGWKFESAISREDLNGFTCRPGEQIGFDIQLDNSDGAERVWSKVWHGTEENFRNRLGFGRLVFAYQRRPLRANRSLEP